MLLQKADLAIGDLTITYERRTAVDFTTPFMNLGNDHIAIFKKTICIPFIVHFIPSAGISILFAKPKKQPPALFSFMAPLSLEVWMYMVTTYLAISIVLFFIAKYIDDFSEY